MRLQVSIHELGHAWVAAGLGYITRVVISDGDPRCEYVSEDVRPEHLPIVAAGGFAAERVMGVGLRAACRSSYDDLLALRDLLGVELAEEIINRTMALFREEVSDFRGFFEVHYPALRGEGEIVISPSPPAICRRCGRPLNSPQSVRRGYGPVCWERQNGNVGRTT